MIHSYSHAFHKEYIDSECPFNFGRQHMRDEIKVNVINRRRKFLYMRAEFPDGSRQELSTGKRRMKEAAKVAAKWEADLQEGRYSASTKITWADFRERYETEGLAGLSEKYACMMTTTFNHLEKTGVRLLSDIRPERISRFQKQLRENGISESTIRTYLKHLKAALSWAKEMEFISAVPTITLPKRGRKKSKRMKGRPVTGEEFDRMLAAVVAVCPHDVYAWQKYLRGLWLSGLRLDESLTLSWDDNTDFCVDLTGKHPRFRIWAEGQKSKKDEYLPMTPDFARFLLETPEGARQGLVFQPLGQRGGIPTSNSVGRVVSAIGRKANVIVDGAADKFATAHDLRRSFGTRWSKQVKTAVLQQLMRHADIKTTMDFYVDQDADDVADDLWRDFGANEESKISAPPTVTRR